MKALDYFFYRICMFKRRDKDVNPIVIGAMYAGVITTGLLLPLFCVLEYTFLEKTNVSVYIYGGILSVFFFLRYRNKKESLIKAFEHSDYNLLFPDWTFIFLFFFAGLVSPAIGSYVETHYLPLLFERGAGCLYLKDLLSFTE